MRASLLCRRLLALLVLTTGLVAGPRDGEWNNVAEARAKDQPQTAIAQLQSLQTAAFATHAWPEGVRALALRIILAPGNAKAPTANSIRQLDAETTAAPPEARPMLQTLQACWMLGFYEHDSSTFRNRSSTTEANNDPFETWDLTRVLTEIDRRFQTALANRETLRKIPVAEFGELLVAGKLDDSLRPTLYDFTAHTALEFYAKEIVAASMTRDSFEIMADSPAFDDAGTFLAWQPETPDRSSPKLRALRIYQELLAFHQADPDRSAFLHCDLERLRWAHKTAAGTNKNARFEAALRAFVAAHAAHPLSADARRDLAEILIQAGRNQQAHEIAKAGAAAFPEHPFGKLCAELTADLERAAFSINMRSTLTPAGEDIVVDHRNLDHIWFRAYRLKWQPDPETVGQGDKTPEFEECERTLLKTQPALAWDAPLPDAKDFAEHLTRLPAPKDLPPGFYAIVASGRPDFSIKNNPVDIAPVHVTKFALIAGKSGNGSIDGFVTNAVTGAPVAGVEVVKYLGTRDNYDTKTKSLKPQTTRSDADGFFSFPGASDNRHSILVVASHQGDRVIARPYGGDENHGVLPAETTTAVVFTDRAIYRPGQTIHFKGILCHTNQATGIYQTVAGKPVTVEFNAAGGKVIGTLQLVSNERGSFAGSFTAPSGNLLGWFGIDLGVYGRTGVRVEEYKRPKFFAKIMPPAAPAALGARVEVKGKAEAYTTAPVDGAKVEWQVIRRATFPAWAFWLNPAMKLPGGDQEIARGSSVTAADGGFSITFVAAPDLTMGPSAAPVFTYEITADITEPSGETRSVREFVAVAYTSLRASVTTDCMPEAGKECRFKVRTETHDGEGRPAKGTLKIHKVVEPQTCPRYDDWVDWNIATDGKQADPSDPNHWPTGELVAEIPITTAANGEAEIAQVLPAGLFRLVFETRDSNNHPVKAMLGLQVLAPDATRFPTKLPFFADSPQWKVEPGKTFTLFWGCGHPEARACVEWRRGSQLLKREWSAPGRTQQAFTWPIDETLQGGFSVTVLQTTMNRLHVFTRTIEVPWSNKKLKLRWEHLTSKLEPGAKDTWTAVISGPNNDAVDAEMVATLYDASLDAFDIHDFPDLAGFFRMDESPEFDHVFSHTYCFINERDDYENLFWSSVRCPYRYFIDRLDYSHEMAISVSYPGLRLGSAFMIGPMLYPVGGGCGGISMTPQPLGTAGFRSGDAVVDPDQFAPKLPQSVGASPRLQPDCR